MFPRRTLARNSNTCFGVEFSLPLCIRGVLATQPRRTASPQPPVMPDAHLSRPTTR
ncbi:hypothetical protein E2C01_063837 [Portunus trituberculatus]|uniref:Uncharacterized protein n=1 Tax=Portunus trituberculatus TaxID=210409 RepID=A0A5B7HK39_PORTR|nr:hypothetical protein [Portunus trituberculatus]